MKVWSYGYRDPVGGGSVTFGLDWGHCAARLADLYYRLALAHWLTASELHRMAQLALFGALDDEFDPLKEIEQRIAQAKRDDRRLRELKAQGGSAKEAADILERTRANLEWLARFDPSHATEIETFLAGSAERMRKRLLERQRC